MRRDPRIINLYDKPAFPRSHPSLRSSNSSTVGTTLLLCSMIVVGTLGFFWAYDAIAHRDSAFVPTITAEARPTQRWDVLGAAPKPDMHSSAVTAAQADVPAAQRVAQAIIPEAAEAENRVDAPPKKKRARVVHRLSPVAAQAYAAEPSFYRPPAPFGGWVA
jgi:hypothetical protein